MPISHEELERRRKTKGILWLPPQNDLEERLDAALAEEEAGAASYGRPLAVECGAIPVGYDSPAQIDELVKRYAAVGYSVLYWYRGEGGEKSAGIMIFSE